jgi:two-component system, NtrC family, response regulator HydG
MSENEFNRYWKTVVDTIQDGIMIVDRSGVIVSVNKALETMTGYSKGEIVGQPCTRLNCNICEIALNIQGDSWCALFKSGNFEMRRCTLMRKNGSLVHVMKNASLLRDVEGKVLGAVETVTDITELVDKDEQLEALREELRSDEGFCGMVGVSPKMQQVFDLTTNAAKSDAPVIILGESGTGKELVARAIHRLRSKGERPFVKVNCAALNESLLESELFGHVKGAFTGAYQSREGRFEAASGGDIFLDEIGDLPLSTQVKLLRVLEDKVIERVGDNRSVSIDVNIITATNRDLEDLVPGGFMREDLYYRINVIPILLPSLRERIDDLPLLVNFFLRRISLKGDIKVKGVSNGAMSMMMSYSWPGNVRELRGALEYACVTCRESVIDQHHLPGRICRDENGNNIQLLSNRNRQSDKKSELITALARTGGNQSEAARLLGVSRVTIWNRMRRFGIK